MSKLSAVLEAHGGIRLDGHFIFTNGAHSTGYFNCRVLAPQRRLLREFANELGHALTLKGADIVVGPETLGRDIAGMIGEEFNIPAIWYNIKKNSDNKKVGFFPEKMMFENVIEPGMRAIIVDDLWTTGSSIKPGVHLLRENKLTVDYTGSLVKRPNTESLSLQEIGLRDHIILTEIDLPGVITETEAEAWSNGGLCDRRVPINLRPGHGHDLIKHERYKGYPSKL